MSFLYLWTGRFLEGEEDIKAYIDEDIRFLVDVAEENSYRTSHLRELRDKTAKTLTSDQRPEEVEKLVSHVLHADGEWNNALTDWMPTPTDRVIELTDGKVQRLRKKLIAEYGREEKDIDSFIRPEDVLINGERPTDLCGYVQQNNLADAMLDLEWFLEVGEASGLAIDREFKEKARKESAEYFSGKSSSMSADVRDLQISLLKNSALWIENVKQEFGFRSAGLSFVARQLRKEARELKGEAK
ncbi:MAG: hypothetical protein ABEJ98_00790 [Candidatus Nanohaloarchaea archaeon]